MKRRAPRSNTKRSPLSNSGARLIDKIPFAAFLVNSGGVVVACNGHASSLTGWSRRELRGMPLPSIESADSKSLLQYLSPQSSEVHTLRTILLSKDGRGVPALLHITRVGRQTQRTALACVLAVRLQQDRQPNVTPVGERRFHTATRLIGSLVHDFANQLGALAGWTSGLQQELSADGVGLAIDPARRAYVARAAAQIRASTSAVLEVLDTVRRARRVASEQRRAVLLDEAIRALALTLDTGRATLTLTLQASDVVVSVMAGDLLDLLAHALVVSGCKNSSGAVTIATRTLEPNPNLMDPEGLGYVAIDISASKTRLPEVTSHAALQQLADDPGPPDLALSLAALRAIAEENGGFVPASSGDAPSITIVLPRTSLSLLIVDDNQGLLTWMTAECGRWGWSAVVAASVQDAQAVIDDPRTPIDVLLTDFMLPDGTGIDVAVAVRKRRASTPVVLTSGMVLQAEIQAMANRMNVVVLYKPFLASDIKTMIGAMALGLRQP